MIFYWEASTNTIKYDCERATDRVTSHFLFSISQTIFFSLKLLAQYDEPIHLRPFTMHADSSVTPPNYCIIVIINLSASHNRAASFTERIVRISHYADLGDSTPLQFSSRSIDTVGARQNEICWVKLLLSELLLYISYH
ncbi:hypothetical protein Ddc_11020 [Ditylenchus destructor]|nr:hypothetical protein Ddc_11020 [Ditylenchus destructor]